MSCSVTLWWTLGLRVCRSGSWVFVTVTGERGRESWKVRHLTFSARWPCALSRLWSSPWVECEVLGIRNVPFTGTEANLT
jgi:hypothetical protein